MLAAERRDWMMRELRRQGGLRASHLAGQLGVTIMTVWRDLQALEKKGLLRRVHGGALPAYPAEDAEPDYSAKAAVLTEERLALARYAARRFPRRDSTLIVEGGTTAVQMVSFLSAPDLTVLTNSTEALRLARSNDTLLASGGIYRPLSRTLVGPQAVEFFCRHRADFCFLSATGFRRGEGLTDPNPLEIEVKRAMAKAARTVVLLLDHSKFGVVSLEKLFDLTTVHTLVTNSSTPSASLKPFRSAGVSIELV